MRTWGGRFSGETDARVADFTRSIEVDAALARDDIAGSIAHVRGLGRAGLLTADEVADARRRPRGAARRTSPRAGSPGTRSLEDVHLNLEAALAEKVGPLAGKLHTGRSRNDQVATDLRLWTRRAIDELDAALLDFERALVDLAERDGTAVLPGTTHIQPAQPVLFAHHLLAYVEMAERDRGRLADARARLNVSPLGSGALAGAGYPLDREATATRARLRRRHAPTRSTPSRTATSWSRRSRRSRSGWSTSAGWPRRSPGGRTRGSGSSAWPMRSRPAAR